MAEMMLIGPPSGFQGSGKKNEEIFRFVGTTITTKIPKQKNPYLISDLPSPPTSKCAFFKELQMLVGIETPESE